MRESFHNSFCSINLFSKSEFSLMTSLSSKYKLLQMLVLLGSFSFRVEQEVGLNSNIPGLLTPRQTDDSPSGLSRGQYVSCERGNTRDENN